jgi:hypothetical protein
MSPTKNLQSLVADLAEDEIAVTALGSEVAEQSDIRSETLRAFTIAEVEKILEAEVEKILEKVADAGRPRRAATGSTGKIAILRKC